MLKDNTYQLCLFLIVNQKSSKISLVNILFALVNIDFQNVVNIVANDNVIHQF